MKKPSVGNEAHLITILQNCFPSPFHYVKHVNAMQIQFQSLPQADLDANGVFLPCIFVPFL